MSVLSRLSALNPFASRAPVVAVLRLAGPIGERELFGGRLEMASVASPIARAFDLTRLAAVALLINSPGGSPVQSTLIVKRIRALAAEKGVKVYAFCEDVAASGGYMLACAADEIYADPSSIIGSIGVVSGGFGFPALLDRLGIERRVYTAGTQKAMLDPFRPEQEGDVAHLKTILAEVHRAFVALVKERRGTRLAGSDEEMFNGAFWAGAEAQRLGLVDGMGDLRGIMRAKFGEDVVLRLVSQDRSWWSRLVSRRGAGAVPEGGSGWTGLGAELVAAAAARSLWGRYGL